MAVPLRLIILEDNPQDVDLIKLHLSQAGIEFEYVNVETKNDFENALDNFSPDAILCDHTLPQYDSVKALKLARKKTKNIPFILVTGSVSEEFAVQMIHSGAHDYIIKDRMARLPSALMNAIQKCHIENERLKYFEDLIANEERFKKAEKIAHFGVWDANLISDTVKWSDETYRILGYENTDFEPGPNSFYENMHPDDVEKIKTQIENAYKGETTGSFEYRIIDKDGTVRIVQSVFLIERDDSNTPFKVTGFNKDITQRKKAEEEKKKANEELIEKARFIKEISDNIPGAIFQMIHYPDGKTKMTYVSEYFEDLWGLPVEEVMKESTKRYQSVHPDDLERVLKEIDECVKYKGKKSYKYRNVNRSTKKVTWVRTNCVARQLPDGSVLRTGVVIDINDSENYYEQLEKSNERYECISMAANESLWDLDLTTNIFTFGGSYKEMFGHSFPDDKCTSETIVKMVHPEDAEKIKQGLAAVLSDSTKRYWEAYYRVVKSDGDIVYVYDRGYVIYDQKTNTPVRFVGATQDITERKKAEEDLKKSLKETSEYKYAIDESSLVSIVDENGIIKYVNKNFCLLSEYSREELIGKTHQLFVREDKEGVRDKLWDELKQGRIWRGELKFQKKGGDYFWVDSTIIPFLDDNGVPYQYMAIRTDITERKQIEEELIKSLKETSDYKYAIDESSIVAITDQNGIIKHANDNFCKISKYSREELVGANHRIVNSGYHPQEFFKNLWMTISHGKVWRGEIRNMTKEGDYYWVDTTIVPFLNERGKPYQHVSIRKDITSRKIAEESLMQSEHRFRKFFESAPEAILILDIEKKVFVDFNDNALQLLKTTREDLMHASPLKVTAPIQPEGIGAEEKMIGNIHRIKNGESLTTEWLVVDSEGNEIFCEIRSSMLSDFDKNFMRLSVIDITDRKNAELERNKITSDLFSRNKDLERFTYIVSHNLRAPVANILGFSEELNGKDITEEERLIFHNELHAAVKRLDEVILDLNDILNINNVIKEKKEEVFFSQIIHNIKKGIEELIESDEVEIITNFRDAPEMITIKSYIHSIFYNLISNSIKYKQHGKKAVIEITSSRQNGRLSLVFKDNGTGIDLEKTGEHMFGLYKKFHHNSEGKGVGLFMVKAHVTALGGKISVDSKINEGTTFTIEFNS
jgi:PAS domain S-box-containing protein